MRPLHVISATLLCFTASLALAESPEQAIRSSLKAIQPDLEIQTFVASPLPGIHEAHLSGGRVLYFSDDGRHMLQGYLFDFKDGKAVNLTEQIKNRAVAKELNAVPVSDMVVFSPEKPKTHITVFTDPDCGFCQKLHEEVPALNKAGIEVRYMAFPRQGAGSAAYNTLVSVWCADDRRSAMNKAKSREALAPANCENPVDEQLALGEVFGIQGTPAIVLADGTMISGYRPAAELAKIALSVK
ncbi:DsbC family protein [Pseudomonas arsenicoxydans]|uniref:Thiol:disulfide interchange protein n=1 Tax=Pseudomonas arsenicoxydans TaxID=702115 RepID=A0A502GW45_9PSED|nr:DsbC family protein [Pseudomonas arsenicoxydans]TPG65692.1 DsbC family protein [Pseudomonas arsenicoxydans]